MNDIQDTTQTMSLTDNTSSLASIPVYYPSNPLLSDWPEQYMKVRYRYDILKCLTFGLFGSYYICGG